MKKFLIPVVFALSLTGCKGVGQPEAVTTNDNNVAVAAAKDLTIAYVNFDTLLANYNLYKDMSSDFGAKSAKIETELTTKGRSLERDIANYQERAGNGLLTALQARTTEEELAKKQQEFIAYRDRVVGELSEEESVMLNQIQYNIKQFTKEYNKGLRYSMILYTNANGPVLDSDPSLDITREFIDGLNKAYEAEAAAKTKPAK